VVERRLQPSVRVLRDRRLSELDALTECLARRVGAWFEHEGRDAVEDAVFLRQMNMAIALAASRWNELAGEPQPVERMRAWLDEVRRRADVRGTEARIEAFDRARGWFDECAEKLL
jgi:hypothetical protein